MDREALLIGSLDTAQVGELWVAISQRGLVAVEFGVGRAKFEASLRRQPHQAVERAPRKVKSVLEQVAEYLRGMRRVFEIPIDWSALSSDFQRAALRAVNAVPYGETRTYGQIAALIGHPDAPRAVGRANATNPMPLVIPCHRLVGSDGKLHGYGGAGGLKTKAWLLALEGAAWAKTHSNNHLPAPEIEIAHGV